MTGIGGHQKAYRGRSDDWLTPPDLLKRLGPFDLDPCASAGQPWASALRMYTPPQDGLSLPWDGLVYLNPPYGPETWRWLAKLAEHPGGGIALIFARTETRGFFSEVWRKADALLFLEGRLFFHHPTSGQKAKHNAGGPSVLVAYGDEAASRLLTPPAEGMYIELAGARCLRQK